MLNQNNSNSNNFLLGINYSYKNLTEGDKLVYNLKKIENKDGKKVLDNTNFKDPKKIEKIVDNIITKLEKDVILLTDKIKNHNNEKKKNNKY